MNLCLGIFVGLISDYDSGNSFCVRSRGGTDIDCWTGLQGWKRTKNTCSSVRSPSNVQEKTTSRVDTKYVLINRSFNTVATCGCNIRMRLMHFLCCVLLQGQLVHVTNIKIKWIFDDLYRSYLRRPVLELEQKRRQKLKPTISVLIGSPTGVCIISKNRFFFINSIFGIWVFFMRRRIDFFNLFFLKQRPSHSSGL